MKLNINQLRRIIAEEVSVLRESDRELFFDKLVPAGEADAILAAASPSFNDSEMQVTMSSKSNRIPPGMERIRITADPGKRVAKMLAAYQDYDAAKGPGRSRPGAAAAPKNSAAFQGLQAQYPRLLAFVMRSKDRAAFLEQLAAAEGNAQFNGEGIDGLELLADYANDLL